MKLSRPALYVAVSFAVSACGVSSPHAGQTSSAVPSSVTTRSTSNGQTKPAVSYLSPKDIDAQAPDSAARAFLMFWSEMQTRDLYSAYNAMSTQFRAEFAPTLRHFGTYTMADYLHWLVKPKILSTMTNGAHASVVVTYAVAGGEAPRETFLFIRQGQSWQLAYDFYLANRMLGR